MKVHYKFIVLQESLATEENLRKFIELWKSVVMTKQFASWLKELDKRPGND